MCVQLCVNVPLSSRSVGVMERECLSVCVCVCVFLFVLWPNPDLKRILNMQGHTASGECVCVCVCVCACVCVYVFNNIVSFAP